MFITSHHDSLPSTGLTTIHVDLHHLAEVVFVRFLFCQFTFPEPSLLICTLLIEVSMCSPHFVRSGELHPLAMLLEAGSSI